MAPGQHPCEAWCFQWAAASNQVHVLQVYFFGAPHWLLSRVIVCVIIYVAVLKRVGVRKRGCRSSSPRVCLATRLAALPIFKCTCVCTFSFNGMRFYDQPSDFVYR